MSWRTTWLLFTSAIVVAAFILLVERNITSSAATEPRQSLLALRPGEVTSLQLRRTNQFVLRAARTNDFWNLLAPVNYPAQTFAIESLLKNLSEATTHTSISPNELSRSRRTIAEYGLDVPLATLTVMQGQRRIELSFGSKTPAGDHVYVQLLDSPGIHVVDAKLFDQLPRSATDWRDNALVNLVGLSVDRFELRAAHRGFGVAVNPTNGQYYLFRPAVARADRPKVQSLLQRVQTTQILEFVSDDAHGDQEAYGLAKPEAELVFGTGSNDVVVVQFGGNPPGNTNVIYARRMAQTNIVLVPRSVLDALQAPISELRDRHLFTFAQEVDTVEVISAETFSTRKQVDGSWIVVDPQATLLDSDSIVEFFKFMARLEGEVEKDLVTDFAPYGLVSPARQYLLKVTLTNSTGHLTNRIVSQLEVGARQGDKVFVRRADEPLTVYSISTDDVHRLPVAAWQLRDRRVWSFSTNQVTRLFVRHGGATNQLLRRPAGEWSLAAGSTGLIKPMAVEELMHQLGELRAYLWVARGDENRAKYGLGGTNDHLGVELKIGDKTHVLNLEFGSFSPISKLPYASTVIDGQPWIFEFPADLFWRLHRDLISPLRASASL